MFKDDFSNSQVWNKLEATRFGLFNFIEMNDKNALKLDRSGRINIHSVIHVSYRIPIVERAEYSDPAVTKRPAHGPGIGGGEHIVNTILSPQQRGGEFQFLRLMKGDSHYEAVWQPTKDFLDNDETVSEIWKRRGNTLESDSAQFISNCSRAVVRMCVVHYENDVELCGTIVESSRTILEHLGNVLKHRKTIFSV